MSLPDAGERVPLSCPTCSPDEPTVHEVLKPGGHSTVRCTECGHVHKEKVEIPDETEMNVVVSQDGDSVSTEVPVPVGATIEVGDEFIVDTPEAIQLVRITGIEVGPEQRADEAEVADVKTVWTRVVDNVAVNVTIHPKDGKREDTRSVTVNVPGDYEFVVGETEAFGDEEVEIEGLVVRSDAPEYRHGKLDHPGDMVYAKDAKRVYARDQTSTAWSAW
ncbi:HVO_0476 family zinc finger protein [Haloferax sp. KTX1]|uniref:HVO_0476 family zinc finger protein n=1 Tax=Haloferax sp. KTX1 TaxID=2600597 RepID=UPI0011DDB185|nr:HVO_0476 family zinc finger protein [Haloferax sp. KTX1]